MSETPSTTPPSTPAANDDATEVIAAVAAGERYALARIYDEYARPLFGLAYRLLHNRTEAEDIIQDVFVALPKLANDFDPARGSVQAWLVMLVRSRSLDRVRRTRRRADLVAAAAPEDLGWEAAAGTADTPADVAARTDRYAEIRSVLAELPEDQRKALELAYYTGLTQQEIADRLQEPVGTIKARVRRSLLKLREMIGGRHE